MLESFDQAGGMSLSASSFSWRTIISAWFVALLFFASFAAADAVASLHKTPSKRCALAGAVIPRHDPSYLGPDEIAASDWLERVRAEAYGSE